MSRDTTTDDSGTTRRAVLRTAAAGAVAGLAAAGGASARTMVEPADYADPIAAEAAFADHGEDLLSMLADEGLLAEGDVTELHTRRPTDIGAVAADAEGTALVYHRGGRRFVSKRRVDGGTLSVTVEPEDGRAYAIFRPDDGSARRLFQPANDLAGANLDGDFGTTADCDCRNETCSDGSRLEECTSCFCGTDCDEADKCCCTTDYSCC